MPARWNEELTYKFVILYREHECLWNMYNELFRNKQARQTALNDMCVKMELENFGINDAKLKIKSLRATFQQEQKKIEQSELSGAGAECVYKPTVKWFPLMKDIMRQAAARQPSQSNLVSRFDYHKSLAFSILRVWHLLITRALCVTWYNA